MNTIQRLKLRFKKPKLVELIEVIAENCIGCGKCAKMCKMQVFEMRGRRAVVSNPTSCVGCGKCVKKMCNFGAINLVLAQ